MAPAQSRPLGWPFLVARGRTVGYRCLLAPDFLADTGRQGIITDAVTGEALDAGIGGVRVTTVPVPDIGLVTLAYQVRQATDADVHEPDGAPAADHPHKDSSTHGLITDDHGRPLELLYGVLCITPAISDVDDLDLTAARAEALRTFRRFLTDEASFTVEAARASSVRSTMSTTAVPVSPPPLAEHLSGRPTNGMHEPDRSSGRSRPSAASITAALLAGALALVVWMAIGAVQPVKGVDVTGPDPVSADCTEPVDLVFDGIVTTRRSSDVTYHWEGTHNTDRRSHRLTFEQRGSQPVSTTLVVQGSPGQEVTGEQRLVVDEPNKRADSATFVVRCDG